MIKIGHRGAKGYASENTLASFQKAQELKVDGIELDIHLSKDGVPVVIHDATVNRTTSQQGFVRNFTATQLQEWQIPSLQQVIDIIEPPCFINIEIKDPSATTAVMQLLEKNNASKLRAFIDFQISSFNWSVLEEVSNINPNLFLGVLTENSIEEAMKFGLQIKAKSINPKFSLLTIEKVTLLHENGFHVFPWTVNTFTDIEAMKHLGVDGIISDFPDRI